MSARTRHYNQASTFEDESSRFVDDLFHNLDRQRADARGELRWTIERLPADKQKLLQEAQHRGELMKDAQKQPVELGPRVLELIAGIRHTLPLHSVQAAWVRDPRVRDPHLTKYSPPKLFIHARLRDPAVPKLESVLLFSSNLPLGSDLGNVGPADLDPIVVLAERWGTEYEAALYEIAPHPVEQSA